MPPHFAGSWNACIATACFSCGALKYQGSFANWAAHLGSIGEEGGARSRSHKSTGGSSTIVESPSQRLGQVQLASHICGYGECGRNGANLLRGHLHAQEHRRISAQQTVRTTLFLLRSPVTAVPRTVCQTTPCTNTAWQQIPTFMRPFAMPTCFSCLEARCVCRQTAVNAAEILTLVRLA